MTTFVIMWYVYQGWNGDADKAQLFQTAWFLESLMTQVCTPAVALVLIGPLRMLTGCTVFGQGYVMRVSLMLFPWHS